MASLTRSSVQWFVAMVLGTIGFAHELFTTRNPGVMTVCVGLIGARYALDKGGPT